ncbi:MFS transporter [Nocardioides taihuensis]|uniref:MFS transporter n=1 Tax=Nocardioides taihuensis TaxID=1835606 RepID=A0ABW0BMW3_9ACTN
MAAPDVLRARNAVALVFVLNGFCFAALVTRLPDIRGDLGLTNGQLGLLLLCNAAGSVPSMPVAGRLIERWGAGAVVRGGAVLVTVGLTVVALGASTLGAAPVVGVGLFTYGVGTGVWDVSMNVEAAAVEQRLGRTVMPRFHAGWSMGSIAGAALGIPVNALDVPLLLHLGLVAGGALVAVVVGTRAFLPAGVPHGDEGLATSPGRSAWLEPRTLAIGLMVLAFALTEGVANDWLALALIDGYDVEDWVGVAGFAVFVTAMTAGRLVGTTVLDRYGRVPVLRATALAGIAGVLLVVLGGSAPLVLLGIVVWGLGASLGFPVGMSAGADDPLRAARRVSAISTIGYTAFFAGPPLIGWVADRVGTLDALLVVAALLVPSFLAITAAREPEKSAAR